MATIRKFSGDVSVLRPIIRQWELECNAEELGINLDMTVYLRDLQRLVDGLNSDLLVLEDDEIIGYMGLETFNSPLGNQLITNEHFWYVSPDKRGLSALKFLSVAEKWAKEKGCSYLIMNASYLASDLHDRTCKIYEKFGMQKFESSYIKGI